MRKLLAITVLVASMLFGSMAFAQVDLVHEIEGVMEIVDMRVHGRLLRAAEAELGARTLACELDIIFYYEDSMIGSGQFNLSVVAIGDAINNALWVSRAVNEPLDVKLMYTLDPIRIQIIWVEAPGGA